MYNHVLMKLPEDVIMSVGSLISDIEADPVKQETSYQLIKNAFGKTKWQMAYALLDLPDLGDHRPSAMMVEMLSFRFETSAPDLLFFALFLHRLPPSIRDHLRRCGPQNGDRVGKPCRHSLGRQEYRICKRSCRFPRRRFCPLCFA